MKEIDTNSKNKLNILQYDYFTCNKMAKQLNLSLEQIFNELNEYAVEFVLYWLARNHNIDIQENIVDGTYTSVWEGEGKITSNAKININTGKVEILKSFDPSEVFTEDGEPFECEFLQDEYVTINGINYPCCNIQDLEFETCQTMFYYE